VRITLFIAFVILFGRSYSIEAGCLQKSERLFSSELSIHKPNPVWLKFFKKQKDRKRIIASVLAFPLPFGWIGIHRLYLGTEPFVPLIYAGTLGGCVGILPLIDFINLVCNKDISRFRNNPHIFMWVDNEVKK